MTIPPIKKVVTFGEIMMRLSTPGFARFTQAHTFDVVYGGSEANVAVSLAHFGVPTVHVTRFPEHDLGQAATAALRQHGVDTRHIIYGPERMGLYFLENGAAHRASRILYDRFDSAFAHIEPGMIDWETVFQDAGWFHWTGITAAISQGAADACAEALQVARQMGVTISGDINYRRNLWQYGKRAQDVMPALIALCDYVVAGITDFENCLGLSADTFEATVQAAQRRCPSIKKVATTTRESISSSHNTLSGVLCDGRTLHTTPPYELVPMVDRIGAGDAFMAGLIYGWHTHKTDEATLAFATAACAWKHTIAGDVNVASVAEIEALVKGDQVGKLLR